MTKKFFGLGKGLGSLIPDSIGEDVNAKREHVFYVEVTKIQANPDQPRTDFDQEALQDLSRSIRKFGVLQPLLVSKIEEDLPLVHGDRQRLVARMTTPAGATPVTRLVGAADGSVWAGTANGLARLDPATAAWSYFTVANGGLPAGSDVIGDLIQRPDGTMVASTAVGLVARAPGASVFAPVPGGAPGPIASAGSSAVTGLDAVLVTVSADAVMGPQFLIEVGVASARRTASSERSRCAAYSASGSNSSRSSAPAIHTASSGADGVDVEDSPISGENSTSSSRLDRKMPAADRGRKSS